MYQLEKASYVRIKSQKLVPTQVKLNYFFSLWEQMFTIRYLQRQKQMSLENPYLFCVSFKELSYWYVMLCPLLCSTVFSRYRI